MCKRLIFLIPFILALGLAGYALAQDAVIPAETPTIDGIKEDAWLLSEEHTLPYTTRGDPPDSGSDCSGSWWALWDTDYFYVFMDVNDSALQNDSPESWNDDSVEVYIDIGNDKQTSYGDDDYQYRVSWNAAGTREIEDYHYGRGLVGVEYVLSAKGSDIGYTVEIKFPWETLDYLKKGVGLDVELGFDVHINDDDNGGDRDTKIAWHDTTDDAWNNPSLIGTVVLGPSHKACSSNPRDGAEGVRSGLLQWTAGIFAASHELYFDPCETKVQNRSNCQVNGAVTTDPCYTVFIAPNTIYYWAIDEVNETGPDPCFWEGNVWTFTTASLTAHSPDPCDGEQLVDIEKDLFWGAGFYSQGHIVYFDLCEAKVQARSGCEVNVINVVDPCYPLNPLDVSTTYYWAIDEVNTTGPDPCFWPGDVWEFTTVPVAGLGSILCEVWRDIGGDAVSDLTENVRYPDSPNESSKVPLFEDQTSGEDYGTRMHGWLYVWDTGDYTFWIASDEQSELWLSTDDSENADLIAFVPNYTAYRTWNEFPEQQSSPIHLVAGNTYYIMALHKEGTGGDHLAVAWSTIADPNTAEVIPGKNLVPYEQRASFRPTPRDGTMDVESEPTLNWKPGKYADKHDVYFGTDRIAVRNAGRTNDPCHVLVKQDHDSNSIDIVDLVGALQSDTTYYWRIDDFNTAGPDPCYWKGRVWSFTVEPSIAYNPNPSIGGVVSVVPVLSWAAGVGAVEGHVVFFDNDFNEVNDAPIGTSGPPPFRAFLNVADTNWLPPGSGLAPSDVNTTYYWRIDEVQSTSPQIIHKGDIWNFTTVLPVSTPGFAITYYDNYNYTTGQWDTWSGYDTPLYVWNDEYLVNFASGKTEATSHYLPSIDELDLRGGFTSLDVPPHSLPPYPEDEDWNPLKSIGDDASGQSPHHVFAAVFTGWVYFEEGDLLSLASDDDSYIFLDDYMGWGEEILSIPHSAYFEYFDTGGYVELTIPAELAGYHWMTVKFADRFDINSGIEINLNGESLPAICFPHCHPDYDEWVAVGKPDCWCYLRQCHGDSDDTSEYIASKGYYYVHFKDLGMLLGAWNVREPPEGPGMNWPDTNICADFGHDKEYIKGKGYYRVHFKDLGILLSSWNVREAPDGPGIPDDCLDCP